jgi:hypothetical protein
MNNTITYKKVDDLDIVVEVKINKDGKIVSQQSFTKEQVEKMKANQINANTNAMARFDALLDVFI